MSGRTAAAGRPAGLWLPPLVWMAALFLASHSPAPPAGPDWPGVDKALHAGAYALLGGLWWRALRRSWPHAARSTIVLAAALITSLYGASDEWHQSFVPHRHPDMGDWVADTLGGLVSVVALDRLRRRRASAPDQG